jgi:hypothetical protein
MFMYPSRQARIPDLDQGNSTSVVGQAIGLAKSFFIYSYNRNRKRNILEHVRVPHLKYEH